ncbi:MAG: aldehyde dehydrogenase family protein [Ignavibacteriae bacterium]|nr:aldehyde dehydrogenase family protein [Ignavibacteriota bacterium]
MDAEKFIIGNELVSSPETKDIINPYTNQVVRKVYKSSKQDINHALDYLTGIFPRYRDTPTYIKASLLEGISKKISERREDLAMLITLETGKPIRFSRIEIDRAILTFKLGSEESKRIEGEVLDLDLLKGSEGKMGIVKRFPLGVILAITPWNFPINLVAHKLSPALASGNTILLKPASTSMTCGIELVKIIKEASAELGLDYCPVNVVTASGGEINEFLDDSRVKLISFTGSSSVGWGIRKKAVKQKVSLELGGNAGVIVDKDADIPTAVTKIITGAFGQAGQSCISVQRVFVHNDIMDSFRSKLLEETAKIKFGDPFDENTLSGPMIEQKEAERIQEWVNEAKDSGANISAGGNRDGAVFEPTIVEKASPDLKINADEVFAPLLTLTGFSDFKEAVKMVGDSEYGLQAGAFTNDLNNALYAFDNIEVGGVVINDVPTYRMDSMPYGGSKDSGNTREGIKYAIEEMTERRILVLSK